jgi:hypothetical protein
MRGAVTRPPTAASASRRNTRPLTQPVDTRPAQAHNRGGGSPYRSQRPPA